MTKWNGLEVPKLPRGVYLHKQEGLNGILIRANTDQFDTRPTNLVHIDGKKLTFWGRVGHGSGWSDVENVSNEQQALDYAVAMLWLGEVKYTLDEGRIDVRHED